VVHVGRQAAALALAAGRRCGTTGSTQERCQMRTSNLDKVLDQITGADCQQAADELERYLDAGLTATRELLAAFLNDLNDECLARWGPHGDGGQAAGLPAPPS
jgi:hypothetical protein